MNSPDATGITGKRVRLRALARADLETLRGFVNDPEVMRFSNQFHPVDQAAQEQWFESLQNARDAVWFGIEDLAHDAQLIGTCCLVGIDWVSRVGELRIRIGARAAWGAGLGSEATGLLLRYGFCDLNLERIWLRVFASNERAIRLYKRHGFQLEGTLRRATVIQGVPQNVHIMGLLRQEWGEEQ